MGSYFVQHPDGYDVEFDDSVNTQEAIKAMAKGANVGFSDIPPQGESKSGLIPLIQSIVKGDVGASDIAKGLVSGLKEFGKTAPDKMDKAIKGDETAAMQLMTDLFAGTRLGPGAEAGVAGSFIGSMGMRKSPALEAKMKQAVTRLPEAVREFSTDPKTFKTKYGDKMSPMDVVHRETGMVRGPDGNWRYEVDDSQIKFDPLSHQEPKEINFEGKKVIWRGGTLGEILGHPELFKLYPELKNRRVDIYETANANDLNFHGQYYPKSGEIMLVRRPGRTDAELRSTLLHEVQHAIQHIEGHAFGANASAKSAALIRQDLELQMNDLRQQSWMPGADKTKLANKIDDIRDQIVNLREYYPHQVYLRSFGELEARLTQAREKLNAQERLQQSPLKEARQQLENELAIDEVLSGRTTSFKEAFDTAKEANYIVKPIEPKHSEGR